jgi:two-component sensor histidine kinase
MKNTIAMIQAIANQTLRGGDETEKVKALFLARLGTLSAAQDVLTQSAWARASLPFLIGETLKAHCNAAQFSMNGPEVELASKMALAMALALHELATNATKYGALSRDDGRIAIGWSMTADEFHFRWQEIGGPPVAFPTHRGFGSRMIEKALASSVQGTSKIAYEPAGVVFTLTAPIEALTTD